MAQGALFSKWYFWETRLNPVVEKSYPVIAAHAWWTIYILTSRVTMHGNEIKTKKITNETWKLRTQYLATAPRFPTPKCRKPCRDGHEPKPKRCKEKETSQAEGDRENLAGSQVWRHEEAGSEG